MPCRFSLCPVIKRITVVKVFIKAKTCLEAVNNTYKISRYIQQATYIFISCFILYNLVAYSINIVYFCDTTGI